MPHWRAATQTMGALALVLQYAIAYDVHDPDADHSSFAIQMDEMDRPLDAIRSFRAAARFSPSSSAAHYNLAVALTDDSNPGAKLPHMRLEAQRALERALQLDPHNDDAARELGAMHEGRDDEVMKRSDVQLQSRPGPKPMPVPRARWGSPLAHVLQREQRAFVWEDANIVAAAADRWSLGMLARSVPPSQHWKTNMNADGRFLYGVTDESEYAPYGFNFKADAGKNQTILNMQQFQHAVLSGSGRSGYGKAGRSRQSHLYLSDTLTLRSRVNALKGTEFGDTLGRLRYDRVESVWSSLGRIKDTETVLLLWIGTKGSWTPAHYDNLHNVFCQVSGRKRLTLYAPEHFNALYPFPMGHASDRQTQVDTSAPDLSRWPLFAQAQPMVAELGPGECMLLPAQWFHEVSTVEGGNDDGGGNTEVAISLSFWNKYYDESAMPLEGRRSDARRYVEWQTSQAGLSAMEQTNLLLKLSQANKSSSGAAGARRRVTGVSTEPLLHHITLTPSETNALDKVLAVVQDELSEQAVQSSSRRSVLVNENGFDFLVQTLTGRFGVVDERNQEYLRGVRPDHCLDRSSCEACTGTNSSLGYMCGWCSSATGRDHCIRLVPGDPHACGSQNSKHPLKSLSSCPVHG